MTATGWTLTLTIASALCALGGVGFAISGFWAAKKEAEQTSEWNDVEKLREVIGAFVLGAKLWQPFLGLGLTALSVLFALGAGLIGAFKQ